MRFSLSLSMFSFSLSMFSYLTSFRESKCKFQIFFYIEIILYSIQFFGVIHFLYIGFCLRRCMSTSCRWCFTFFFVLFLIHYYCSFTLNPLFLTRSLFMKIMFGFSNWILLKKIYLILIYNLFWKCTLKFYSEEYIFILCSGRKNIVLYLWINLI